MSRGRLKDINKEWRESLTSQAESGNELLRDFSRNLPLDSELVKLLNQTFNLKDRKGDKSEQKNKIRDSKKPDDENSIQSKRFPSSFNIDINSKNNNTPITRIPTQGNKTILFSTDVEDQYFDRVEDPGELVLSILGHQITIMKEGIARVGPKILLLFSMFQNPVLVKVRFASTCSPQVI